MLIKAAVTPSKGQPFEVTDLEIDAPRAHEVLVRITACGMCHTDLVVRDQYYPVPLPAVLGHEGAGIVEAVGSHVTKVAPGDHVVMSFGACGECRGCQDGEPGYCEAFFGQNLGCVRPDGSTTLHKHGSNIHGSFFQQSAFATHALAREQNVVKVSGDVPLELLGPLGCGIQTGAGAVMNRFRPKAGSSIAVFGAGSVGLAAVMAARVVGCAIIIAVDPKENRRQLALEVGATHVLDPMAGDPVQAIREITKGGVDYSLECTALPSVFRNAVDCLALRGLCGLVGAPRLGTEVTFDMNTILFGRQICGIIEGDSVPDIFIPQLVELYRQGRFPFDRLVKFYDLEQINQAAVDSESGSTIKPIIRMPAF